MSNVTKVAISLPGPLFNLVEEERQDRQESRSEFFRQALLAYLHQLREQKAVARYIQGYQAQPETAEEVAAIAPLSAAVLAGEPWD
jgi:metal-responsive CopG/Arc/MetJ family transcriptional regulator